MELVSRTTWRLGHSEGGLGGCGRGCDPSILEKSVKHQKVAYKMQYSFVRPRSALRLYALYQITIAIHGHNSLGLLD